MDSLLRNVSQGLGESALSLIFDGSIKFIYIEFFLECLFLCLCTLVHSRKYVYNIIDFIMG